MARALLPIVGRDEELARVDARLELLARRAAARPVLLLEGEPGIGKTRLADELGSLAKKHGALVARGAALADAGAPALVPWRSVARALGGDARAALDVRDAKDRAQDARWRRFGAFAEILAARLAETPLVIVLDDLHDADRESLELALYVARDLSALPLLLVGTLRDPATRTTAANDDLLIRLAREGETMQLTPLSEARTIELVRLAVDTEEPDRVALLARGNPLFALELAALAERGAPLDRARVPESIAAAVRARITQLAENERDSLAAAAILGADVSLPALARVIAVPIDGVLARVSPSLALGLLHDDGGLRVRFAHPLFRETVLGDLSRETAARLHLASAEALTALLAAGAEVTAAEIAHHRALALPSGDPALALSWLERAAADADGRAALEEAADLRVRASDVAAAVGAPEDVRCELAIGAAEALSRAGLRGRAREVAKLAGAVARRSADGPRLARAVLARAAFALGIVDQDLVADLREAQTALGASAPALSARVEARLAAALQPADDPMVPVASAREAVAKARSTGDDAALLDTLLSAGSALADFAPLDERRALAREMIALASRLNRSAVALRGHARLAMDSLESGDLPACDQSIEAHAALARALRAPHHRWLTPAMRAMRAAMQGDFASASTLEEEARSIASRSDDPNAPIALTIASVLHGRETLDDETLAARFDAMDRAVGDIAFAQQASALFRASSQARRGDLEGARRTFGGIRAEGIFVQDLTFCVLGAETVALALPEQAGAWAPFLAPRAHRTLVWGLFSPVWEGPIARVSGLLARALGQHDDAVRSLEAARDEASRLGARPFVARATTELAEALEARGAVGDRERAAALRVEAMTSARALGMRFLVRQLEQETPRAPTPAPTLALTLVRDGETWVISRGGAQHRLKDSRGLRMLDELVRAPDREVHALELAGEPGADGGDAGPVLDARAIAAYRARATDLRDGLDEAERNGDVGRAERARAELDALAEEIASGTGLGGRERRTGSAAEKARVNVQRRLKDAIERISALDRELGAHLEWAVRTGTFCRYRTR